MGGGLVEPTERQRREKREERRAQREERREQRKETRKAGRERREVVGFMVSHECHVST